jgi:hypothetical protein
VTSSSENIMALPLEAGVVSAAASQVTLSFVDCVPALGKGGNNSRTRAWLNPPLENACQADDVAVQSSFPSS